MLLVMLVAADRAVGGAFIVVTSLDDKTSTSGGCSLKEAISSSNFQNNIAIDSIDVSTSMPHIVTTQCVPGTGDDTILVPSGAVIQLNNIAAETEDPFGFSATPMITSNITIEANGALFEWAGIGAARLFTVASTGNLTIRNAHIKGFIAHGGIGDSGGGGGAGLGGAIFVKGSGSLTV